jgi:hypothetical protein
MPGGLRLEGVPVLSTNTKERLKRSLEILQDIQEQVALMGIPEYPKPRNQPEAIADVDLSAMSNRELEQLLSQYTAWAAYIGTKLAEAEVAVKASDASMKAVIASLKSSLFKDGTPKAEVDAKVKTSPQYIEYDLEHLKLYATREILDAHYKAYSRSAQAVSRNIELRKLEYEQEQRHSGVSGFKRQHLNQQRPAGSMRRPGT